MAHDSGLMTDAAPRQQSKIMLDNSKHETLADTSTRSSSPRRGGGASNTSSQVVRMRMRRAAPWMPLILAVLQAIAVSADSSSHEIVSLRRREDTTDKAAGRALKEEEEYTGTCFQDVSESSYCQDNPTYRTWKGLSCSFHAELVSFSAGENCFHEWLNDSWFTKTYNQDEIFDLMYECPCACNIKCGVVNASPTQSPTNDPEPSIGNIDVPAEELSGTETDVDTMDIANRPEMVDETVPVSPSGNGGEENRNDVIDILASATAPDSGQQGSTSPNSAPFFLSGPLGLIAIMAASIVGAAVLFLSVFSLIENSIKKRQEGRRPADRRPTRTSSQSQFSHTDDLSDISNSVHSEESSELDRYEKFRRYKTWKRMQQRGGIEYGDDVIEP
mmetsp:Transcript_12562/g.26586  ORF Transcript_12562/g.26586 Transcript_12562/m.26586 type:complete len:388 (-) Transcript_12562:79-1242(-)